MHAPITASVVLLPALLAGLLSAYPLAGQAPAETHLHHPGVDVLDYDLSLDLPQSGPSIEGRAVLTLRRTAPVDTLTLDLLELRVDSVLVEGRPVAFRREPGRIRVPLPAGSGDTLRVAVRYGGEPADGLIIREEGGRWTAFGDNWPNRGRHWIPSVDHPSDKATVGWTVRAPAERRVIANGVLLEETPQADGRVLTRWRIARPIPVYLMVIGAAPLAFYDLGRTACGLSEIPGCVPQSVYSAPEVRDFLPGPFAQAGPIVEHFSRTVAPFPYERLAHVQSSTRFGGMENATLIFYSDRAFREGTLGVGLVAHETAHQWFGNAVTPRDWPHLWLSEGFATYFTQLWTEHDEGEAAFREGMQRIREQILAAPVVAQRPVVDTAQTDPMQLLNANSYQKGGWVLHMLRAEVGDSAFFQGVRAYYEANRHGTALTDDLRREIERAAGRELGWFFDQWLRRPGFAELTTAWRYDARQRRVVLDVEQGTRFAPYRLPLTVEVVDAAGVARRATVELAAQRRQRIVLPLELDAPPQGVAFDPEVRLLASFRSR
jgi:aminopeptidase N